MTDEQIRERTAAVTQAVNDAREMIRRLEHQAEELRKALLTFEANFQRDIELRKREAAVLAREDRCTQRERDLEGKSP